MRLQLLLRKRDQLHHLQLKSPHRAIRASANHLGMISTALLWRPSRAQERFLRPRRPILVPEHLSMEPGTR
jgi:hypothetical protein